MLGSLCVLKSNALALGLFGIAAVSAINPVCAQSSVFVPPIGNTGANAPPPKEKPVEPEIKLKSGASIVDVEIGNVRDISIDIKRAKTAANHLFDEVTRHPITSYNAINTMGPVMMTFEEPTFDASKVLPPRQKWVDVYMQQITPSVMLIKEDVESINTGRQEMGFNAEAKAKLDEHLAECTKNINEAAGFAETLKTLTAAPPYDNLAIAKNAVRMHKSLDEMQKSTKHLIDELKKGLDEK